MPVLAVWSESALYVSSKETAKKGRNLVADGRCVNTTDAWDLHPTVGGEAQRVRNEATPRRASDVFDSIYDWPTVGGLAVKPSSTEGRAGCAIPNQPEVAP